MGLKVLWRSRTDNLCEGRILESRVPTANLIQKAKYAGSANVYCQTAYGKSVLPFMVVVSYCLCNGVLRLKLTSSYRKQYVTFRQPNKNSGRKFRRHIYTINVYTCLHLSTLYRTYRTASQVNSIGKSPSFKRKQRLIIALRLTSK